MDELLTTADVARELQVTVVRKIIAAFFPLQVM